MTMPDILKMSDEERFELAKGLANAMRANLLAELDAAPFTFHSKLPFKACSFREVLIHRQSDLADTALAMYDAKQHIPALILIRALVETTGLMHSLHWKAKEFLSSKNSEAFDDFLMKGLLGSRDGSTSHESNNILTAVDRMNKEFDGMRDMYNTLCEFTHPNYAGVMGTYSRTDRKNKRLTLGKETSPPPLAYGLAPLIGCMAIFTDHYNSLSDVLLEINALYEERVK